MLRIISGKFKSIKIEQPPIEITRPTTDRIRENIFNIIQTKVSSSIILDCFAGSGAMTIEAISRGAAKVVSIEKNTKAFNVIKNNIEKLKITNVNLFHEDILNYLHCHSNIEFDFIFLDPPYKDLDLLSNVLTIIKNKKLLKKYGTIIIETNSTNDLILPKGLIINDIRTYGKTQILFVSNII